MFKMQIEPYLGPDPWKSSQNRREAGKKSALSHTGPEKSSICELGRGRGADAHKKVICYFKFLITKVIHTLCGKHTSF